MKNLSGKIQASSSSKRKQKNSQPRELSEESKSSHEFDDDKTVLIGVF